MEEVNELKNRLQNAADDYRDLHAENADLRGENERLKAENEKLLAVIIDGAVDAYKREHHPALALASHYDELAAELPKPHGPVTDAYKNAARDIRAAVGAEIVVSEDHMCDLADMPAKAGSRPCEACTRWTYRPT